MSRVSTRNLANMVHMAAVRNAGGATAAAAALRRLADYSAMDDDVRGLLVGAGVADAAAGALHAAVVRGGRRRRRGAVGHGGAVGRCCGT